MIQNISLLEQIARKVRIQALSMTTQAGSGHPGGSLSSADILTVLYCSGVMHYRPEEPNWPDRDRFVLSAGHLAPALYAALSAVGLVDEPQLSTLRQFGSALQGHPHLGSLPGIETSTGSLGQGFSVAVGMALAQKLDHRPAKVFCLMGDGEQGEGQVWESAAVAAKYRLANLVAIIDLNGMQENGPTTTVMPSGDLKLRYEALGWQVREVDGHDFTQLLHTLDAARSAEHAPQVILAKTVMGKGVSFMERDGYKWHGKTLSRPQLAQALEELGGP